MQKKIILFASGNGSNVEEICRFFQQDPNILVAGVYTNNPHAGVIQRLKPFGLEARIFNMSEFSNGGLLKEISDLFNAGILTEDEFSAAKKKILEN